MLMRKNVNNDIVYDRSLLNTVHTCTNKITEAPYSQAAINSNIVAWLCG